MIIKSYQRITALFLTLFIEFAMLSIFSATATSLDTEQQRSLLAKDELLAQRRRARLRFKVPNIRPSGNLEGGIARGNCDLDGVKKLQMKVLLPNTNIGLTTAERPTFFVQISQTSVKEAKFILLNDKGDTIIYDQNFPLTKTGGIISVTLPANGEALEVGKEYRWELAVLCDPDDQSGNPRIQGAIQRIQPSQQLANDLAKVSVRDRVDLYANEGFWYDTLKTLADLRLANPNDPTLATDWKELLDYAGLSTIDREPLLQCCTLKNE